MIFIALMRACISFYIMTSFLQHCKCPCVRTGIVTLSLHLASHSGAECGQHREVRCGEDSQYEESDKVA